MSNEENASSLTCEKIDSIDTILGALIHINGVVQGVGFRPFIYQLAKRYSLTGWVRNTSAGVDIDIDASLDTIKLFVESIKNEAPPLARIDDISISYHHVEHYHTFEIKESQDLVGGFQPISADVSICEDCRRELFDPKDRRYRYPFINCTNCGPRFTIIKEVPYDRPATTMAEFEMCVACYAEYTDPANRRFHAQPIACPDCGPQVWFESNEGEIISKKDEAIKLAREWIKEGKIVAIKGLGGFHLACDATNQDAVSLLRERKFRIDKPFAVMAFSLEQIEQFCIFDERDKKFLLSRERPIVLLKRKYPTKIVQEVAPYQDTIGVMLPYTPLHYLLLEPQEGFPYALVMTSGNLSEEPIAIHNQQAKQQLQYLADGFLLHNRKIYTRCDDSVIRVWKDKGYFIRRSRGYAPLSITIPFTVKEVLAGGGELKNTFCLTKGDQAFLSQHIGNLENYETYQAFEEAIQSFEKLFRITPQLFAYDKHPDYLATKYILERAAKEGLPTVGVQHHHAHIASCMADNMLPLGETVIGVALDGTGYGDDGAIWGGEFLIVTYQKYHRAYIWRMLVCRVVMAAIVQPWRTAIAWLKKAWNGWDEFISPYSVLLKDPDGEKQLHYCS
jgi:hydrogenase maturation protein HypF